MTVLDVIIHTPGMIEAVGFLIGFVVTLRRPTSRRSER